MPANESVTERGNEVQPQEPSNQKASMPANESVNGRESEVQSQEPSGQKASMPANESEDIVMTDQAPTEKQSQGQPSKGRPDLQAISPIVLIPASTSSTCQSQTVRKRKHSIKDHEANSVGVDENQANAELQLQLDQRKLKEADDELAAAKKDLKETKALLKSKKEDLAACRRGLKASKTVRSGLAAEKRCLQKCLKDCKRELSKCMDDLYSLQRADRIPDATVCNKFESLSHHIVYWIEAEIVAFEETHPEAKPDVVLWVGEDKDAKDFIELHPGAGEHLARYLIHHFLCDNVFRNKVYFFGLPDETAQLLRRAELDMATLDTPRDAVAIASWRSETLTALAKNTECAAHVDDQVRALVSRLFEELSNALPIMFCRQEAHVTFRTQVLLPAIELANIIQMSTSDYNFSLPESPVSSLKPATKDLLKVHKMVDSETGRHLKPDSAVVADKDGIIGDLIICLEPSLYRVMKEKKTRLRQKLFLVRLHHPLGKRSKATT